MRILLSTANLGGIDQSAPPHVAQVVPAGLSIDSVTYNDANLPPRPNAVHPRMHAKLPKMLAHELKPGYDWYMWMDGSIYLKHSHAVIWMIERLGSAHIALFPHPFRRSIADEVKYCLEELASGNPYIVQRYAGEPMIEQSEAYLRDPDFVDDQLFACGVFCYSAEMLRACPGFFPDWYYQCARYSVQDQLSMPYLLHKHSVEYSRVNQNLFDSPFFGMLNHLR
jgi:hypothetical protein